MSEHASEEPPIRLRPLGATGLDVAELALGTWGLSGDGYGPVSNRDAEAIIRRAVELGVTLFETSDAYGKGATESLLGRLLEPYPHTQIATRHGVDRSEKPPRKRFDPAYLEKCLNRTLERLRRPVVDVYLLHNPREETLRNGELRAWLRGLKASGKVRCWGVSVGNAEGGYAALEAEAEVIELAYNAFHSADLANLGAAIAEARAGVLAHSVLAYGLLAGLWPVTKTFPEGDHRRLRWIDAEEISTRIRQLDALRTLQVGDAFSLRGVAVRFVLSNHLVSAAVLGPRSVLQLEQLVREAGKGPPYLDEERLAALPVKLAEVGIRGW
ncbi:MAG: aldo/keto reductase [Myxococcales bacterium]|nr:aldo/keto reductase [Polyangiaceae bacterium]MDW8250253.1 aldo/keto reductase [Myxococcales bacterium]